MDMECKMLIILKGWQARTDATAYNKHISKAPKAESENEVYHFNTVFPKHFFFLCMTDNVKI